MTDDDSTTTLRDFVPDAPAPAPFEVMFDRVTLSDRDADAGAYHMLDVWTKNRIYRVDSRLVCDDVIDRATGKSERTHAVVGLRLLGGQRRYDKTVHQTRPFPVPGTEAVFAAQPTMPPKVTSRVERVVLHVRVTSVVLHQDGDAFDDVTNALLHPGNARLTKD